MRLPDLSERHAFTALRALTGVIFITHGAARIILWTVPGFGQFLDAKGFVIGLLLAWLVTIGEIVSGTCLAAGYFVRYCVLFHLTVIVTGIFLVHLPQGWFTVGQSIGGVEYSLLLVAALIYIYSRSSSGRDAVASCIHAPPRTRIHEPLAESRGRGRARPPPSPACWPLR